MLVWRKGLGVCVGGGGGGGRKGRGVCRGRKFNTQKKAQKRRVSGRENITCKYFDHDIVSLFLWKISRTRCIYVCVFQRVTEEKSHACTHTHTLHCAVITDIAGILRHAITRVSLTNSDRTNVALRRLSVPEV